MWWTVLGVFVVFCLLSLVGAIYCVVGKKFVSDIALIILHRFPEEHRPQGRKFRQQGITPGICLAGGSIIYSGSIEMTYVGSEQWDSVVIAYLPSTLSGRQAIARIKHAEREFSKEFPDADVNNDVESSTVRFEAKILPVFAQTPISFFIYDFCLGKIVNGYHKMFQVRKKRKAKTDEDDQEARAGNNPVKSDIASHLLPSGEQRDQFVQLFGTSQPLSIISFIGIESGKMMDEFAYAMKASVICLGHVGGFVKYQSFFNSDIWSYFNLLEFPRGGNSFLEMEDMKDYHLAFTSREKSTERLLQMISISDTCDLSASMLSNV